MHKKNLLIITLHADPAMPPGVGEWGGTHTYMRELLTELSGTAYNIVLVTRKVFADEPNMEQVIPNGKILRLILGDFQDFDKKELYNLHEITMQQITAELIKISFCPDIIHSVYWNSGHAAMKLSYLWNVPYVHSVISNGIGRNLHGAHGTAGQRITIEKEVFHNAAFIICVAESEKNEISKLYEIDGNKIIVAGQYVHPAFLNPSHNEYGFPRKSSVNYKIESDYFSLYDNRIPEESDWWNRKAFTYTGRLSIDKGLDIIIQTWFQLIKKYDKYCPSLWIIGGTPNEIQMFRKILNISEKNLGDVEASGKLVWWGFLDENGISAIYTRTAVLITHSIYEPGGRVAVEAMCEGIPVIATPNGFALDIIKDWHNGFLVSYKNVDQLFIRMEHFIKQPFLSNVLGENAKKSGKYIMEHWNFKKKHLFAYESAIMHKGEYKVTFGLDVLNRTFSTRRLNTYPYNQILVDTADIIQIMYDNKVTGIISVTELQLQNTSSLTWLVKTKSNEYFVKIPYDRLNEAALWAPKGEEPLVISGLKRFQAEIQALSYFGIPGIVGKDNGRHAIIRKKYNPENVSEKEQLTNTIQCLENFYQNDVCHLSALFFEINDSLECGAGYQVTDQMYRDGISNIFPAQYYFADYSLRAELLRWKQYYELLLGDGREEVRRLFDISYNLVCHVAKDESALKPVLIHGGCDLKNFIYTSEVVLLDNEKLHVGWPGVDFADLFITYTRRKADCESKEWWGYLFDLLPEYIISKKLLAAWIILGIYKEAVSDTARLKPLLPRLEKRLSIMLNLL